MDFADNIPTYGTPDLEAKETDKLSNSSVNTT